MLMPCLLLLFSRNRIQKVQEGNALKEQGDHAGAEKCFKQGITITRDMVTAAIRSLQDSQVSYMVAPFEADAQLTYLVNKGYCDAAVTEDTDLLVFGCIVCMPHIAESPIPHVAERLVIVSYVCPILQKAPYPLVQKGWLLMYVCPILQKAPCKVSWLLYVCPILQKAPCQML